MGSTAMRRRCAGGGGLLQAAGEGLAEVVGLEHVHLGGAGLPLQQGVDDAPELGQPHVVALGSVTSAACWWLTSSLVSSSMWAISSGRRRSIACRSGRSLSRFSRR